MMEENCRKLQQVNAKAARWREEGGDWERRVAGLKERGCTFLACSLVCFDVVYISYLGKVPGSLGRHHWELFPRHASVPSVLRTYTVGSIGSWLVDDMSSPINIYCHSLQMLKFIVSIWVAWTMTFDEKGSRRWGAY
jgi:hypothetical protein